MWNDQFVASKNVSLAAAISSVQFSHSVVSNSLWPHGLQYARLPCPSPTPGACSNSCPLSWWCHPTISSCVFPSPSAFNLSQHHGLFQWASSSRQVSKELEFQFLMNIPDWFPLGWTGWVSLQAKELSRSPTTQFKSMNSSACSFLYSPTQTFINDYWKNHSFD